MKQTNKKQTITPMATTTTFTTTTFLNKNASTICSYTNTAITFTTFAISKTTNNLEVDGTVEKKVEIISHQACTYILSTSYNLSMMYFNLVFLRLFK
jgi:hypothetical protein